MEKLASMKKEITDEGRKENFKEKDAQFERKFFK